MDSHLRGNDTSSISVPFRLALANGEVIIKQIIRFVPGRRLLAFGEYNDKSVVVKLFFDKRHAQRHMTREVTGIKALIQNNIPTPALYYEGTTKDKCGQVLIFQRIMHADNLDDIFKSITSEGKQAILKLMVYEIATQHVLGVVQHDMHFKNFLLTDNAIYTLDGAQIEVNEPLLPRKESIKHLALFLAQLGVGVEGLQQRLFMYYAKLRGWRLKQIEVNELFEQVNRWNVVRWDKFSKKIFRKSTQFQPIKRWGWRGMADRNHLGADLQAFIETPDAVFNAVIACEHSHPAVIASERGNPVMLKNGRSSTVIKINLDGKDYVIKRYNIKNKWHWLRRCLRHTRARKCWRMAHKLLMFGLSTAKPVLYLEKTYFGLKHKSYLMTEYLAGADIKSRLHQDEQLIAAIAQLFSSLAKLSMTHGDLKITNFLLDDSGTPMLIDLDGAKEHRSKQETNRAWAEDIKRFLRNFDHQPELQQKFENALGTH